MKAFLFILMSTLSAGGYFYGQAQEQRAAGNNRFPQWSHDGKKIVFTSDRDGDPEIYVMNADGSRPVRLTPAKEEVSGLKFDIRLLRSR